MLISGRLRGLFLLLLLEALCAAYIPSIAQAPDPIRQLRNELVSTNGLRDADVVIVMSESAINDAARRMIGLEVKHPSGATLRIKSADIKLKPAMALVAMEVQASPALAVTSLNLRLAGRMGNAVVNGSSVRLPFELMEVTPAELKGNGFLTRLFSEWLSPKKWNESLPALELPIQLSQRLDFPGASFEVAGEVPMHLTTSGYQINLDLTLQTLLILDGRAVLALNLREVVKHEAAGGPLEGPAGSDPGNEVTDLGRHLVTSGGVHVRFRKEAVNYLLARIASFADTDLSMELRPGRIRSVELGTPFGTILSFTDVKSGSGKANVDQISVERMSEEGVVIRLKGAGSLNAHLAGREIGIPYQLRPNVEFTIKDELVSFVISSEDGHIKLKPKRDAVVPVQLAFPIEAGGRQLRYTRTLIFQAEKLLKSIDLPEMFSRVIELPRKISIGKDRRVSIIRSEMTRYEFSNLKVSTTADALEIDAAIK